MAPWHLGLGRYRMKSLFNSPLDCRRSSVRSSVNKIESRARSIALHCTALHCTRLIYDYYTAMPSEQTSLSVLSSSSSSSFLLVLSHHRIAAVILRLGYISISRPSISLFYSSLHIHFGRRLTRRSQEGGEEEREEGSQDQNCKCHSPFLFSD